MALTLEQMQAEIARLQAENSRLQGAMDRGLTLRVSAKGAVSAYGLGRYPVTLYRSQWDKLLIAAPAIKAFMAANHDKLAEKGATEQAS